MCRARDGGLVHPQVLCDIAQGQGPQRRRPETQEARLPNRDGFGHRQDSALPLAHLAAPFARLLQLRAQVGILAASRPRVLPRQQSHAVLVEPKAGQA